MEAFHESVALRVVRHGVDPLRAGELRQRIEEPGFELRALIGCDGPSEQGDLLLDEIGCDVRERDNYWTPCETVDDCQEVA